MDTEVDSRTRATEFFSRTQPKSLVSRLRNRGTWSPTPASPVGYALATPLVLAVILLVIYPLVQLTQTSLLRASGHPGGIGNYVDFFESSASIRALTTTLKVSAIVTIIALGVGAILAWYLRTNPSRLRKAVVWLSILTPFWMGVIVKNYSIALLLAPKGLINSLLQNMHMIEEPLRLLNTEFAVILGMVYTMIPWATLPLYGVFRGIDLQLIRAAESLGATRSTAVFSIVAPLALPGILATFAIVFVISIGFFVTPVLLGGMTAPFTSSLISLELFNYFDDVGASVAGVILIIVAFAIIGAAWLIVGRDRLERALTR